MIIGAKTLSHCQGKGSLSHNNRDFKPKNVDSGRTKNNVTFIKEPISEAYEKLFGAAVERYNARQKRNDRKIKNGYMTLRNMPAKSLKSTLTEQYKKGVMVTEQHTFLVTKRKEVFDRQKGEKW